MEKLKKIISLLEKQNDDKIPESVIYILYKSGFDSKIALENITDDSIKIIEEYFDDNFEELIGSLKDYRRSRPFKLLPGHRVLIQSVPELINKANLTEKNPTPNSSNFSFVLKWLIQTVEENADKELKGRRFIENVQLFATYLYLMCGRACYETLSANLPIPQANTIRKFSMNYSKNSWNCFLNYCMFITVGYISKSKSKIIEGQLRVQELSEYLERLKMPKKIWICEDASGINAKVEYDPSSDQLVGNVLPLNSTTGMPISFSFLARSAEDIEKHAKAPLSTLVYVVLALPLMPNVPPFVLQIYGTNNKFTSADVKQRWNHTVGALQKYKYTFYQ